MPLEYWTKTRSHWLIKLTPMPVRHCQFSNAWTIQSENWRRICYVRWAKYELHRRIYSKWLSHRKIVKIIIFLNTYSIFKRIIWTWTGIWTMDLQISTRNEIDRLNLNYSQISYNNIWFGNSYYVVIVLNKRILNGIENLPLCQLDLANFQMLQQFKQKWTKEFSIV